MMDKFCQEFVNNFRLLSPTLEHAYMETIRYWEPDLPPVTTIFSALGDQFVKECGTASLEQRKAGFEMIEKAMVDGSDSLITAVATGLIEAMVGRAVAENTWSSVRVQFGPISKAHAESWANE